MVYEPFSCANESSITVSSGLPW